MADFSIRFFNGEHLNSDEMCYLWEEQDGAHTSLKFFEYNWELKEGDKIDMAWSACPPICGQWLEKKGNKIDLQFKDVLWVEKDGNKLGMQFPPCEEEPPVPQEIIVDFYTGGTLESSIQESLLVKFYEGVSLDTDVQTFPFVNLDIVDFYSGQSLETDVSSIQSFDVDISTGEYFRSTLTTSPAVLISVNFGNGESLETNISSSTTFEPRAYHSESMDTVVTTYPADFVTLSPEFTAGEMLETDVATSLAFSVQFYEGQTLTNDFSVYPTWKMQPDFYTGETLNVEVGSTFNKIISLQYTGETLTTTLENYPQIDLTLKFNNGQSMLMDDFQLPLNLANGNDFFNNGESLSISIDEEPNIVFNDGNSLNINLNTEFNMAMNPFKDGNIMQTDIVFKDPIFLGDVIFNNGESVQVDLKTQLHQEMSVLFRQSLVTRTDIDSTTDFDLTTVCCSGEENNRTLAGNDLNLDLMSWEQPASRYDGDKTKFEFSISTLPRFSVDMYEGQQLKTDEYYVDLGDIRFANGENLQRLSADDLQNIQLCRGNFIPDSENIFIELSVDEENCTAESVFLNGEQFVTTIQTYEKFGFDMHEGQNVKTEQEFKDAWVVDNQKDGTVFTLDTFETDETSLGSVKFYEGQSSVTYHPEDVLFDNIHFLAGEYSTTGDVISGNFVEFLESGCLPNEFVPVKPSGDPDWINFNPVPVEEDDYRHEVKARCRN